MFLRIESLNILKMDKRYIGRLFLLVCLILPLAMADTIITTHYISIIAITALLSLLFAVHLFYVSVRAEYSQYVSFRPTKAEYVSLVHDILYHDEFMRLQEYFHHSGHIYDHVKRVSYIAYSITKILSLDYLAAARGGLLHDFFLYDWREKKRSDESRSSHGREHPHIALENAERYFSVSNREADIIVNHMFPKTIRPPKYIEGVVVSLSDKIAAVFEYCRRPFITAST